MDNQKAIEQGSGSAFFASEKTSHQRLQLVEQIGYDAKAAGLAACPVCGRVHFSGVRASHESAGEGWCNSLTQGAGNSGCRTAFVSKKATQRCHEQVKHVVFLLVLDR